MKSATLYKTDGTIETIQPKNGETFSLAELQKYVGGYIEYVHPGSFCHTASPFV